MDITIRDAVPTDVPFLARCVMAAVGTLDMAEKAEDNPAYETICELCAMEHSLYCWNHFRVAVDTKTGEPIGSLLAYDGKRYARARDLAFSYAAEKTGTDLGDSDMETCKGEYYLDSMAILPQYRGHKIGHALIQDAIEQGKQLKHSRFTLIAEKEAESLKAYYSVLGFIPEEEIIFFGHPYIRMALHI